jgi:hypothetical protein
VSYQLSVRIKGIEELNRAWSRAPQLVTKELSRGISSTAADVQRVAKYRAPVDLGILRASIHTEGPHVLDRDVRATVGTNVEYAQAQEEGTGIYGPRKRMIVPIRGKFLVFKKAGQTIFARSVRGVRPRYYFKQAIEDNRLTFASTMRGVLESITRGLAA